MQFIICPICKAPIEFSLSSCVCYNGHQFQVIDGIADLLKDTNSNVINEQEHWDSVADKGEMNIPRDKYISERIFLDYCREFEECIKEAWSETYPQEINIADIGCGTGSAITYLANLKFGKVDYVGLDVSIKIMKLRTQSGEIFPNNWQIRFMRASANINIFKENSLDIVFSASALHHLELESVMEWVSKALKPNGLLILHEPSSGNIFSKIGRKLVKDFHTEGEKPILPKDVKQIAHNHNLNLIYEKGLHYLTGSLQYLMGILRLPIPLSFCVYQVSRLVDSFTTSPSWNYSFIQVYKKIK